MTRARESIVALTLWLAAMPVLAAGPALVRYPGTTFEAQGREFSLPKDGWLALVSTRGAWQLVPARVSIRYSREEDLVYLRSDVVNDRLLFRARDIEAGAVTIVGGGIAPEGGVEGIVDPCAMTGERHCRYRYTLGQRSYEIEFVVVGKSKHTSATSATFMLRQLSPRNTEQAVRVVADPGLTQWHIELAGDLDRDGKLDVVFYGDETLEPESLLYLSTKAKAGDLVGLAEGR